MFRLYLVRVYAHLVSPLNLFIAATAFVFLTISGPFGTFEALSFAKRFGFWGADVVAYYVVVALLKIAIELKLSHFSYLSRSFLLSILMALLLSPILSGIAVQMANDDLGLSSLQFNAVLIFVVTMFTCQLHRIIERLSPSKGAVPRFASRLGADGDCSVYHVTVDDHYLNISAENGEHRLLMRFSDALGELEELDGLRVHRSHWVSKCSVKKVVLNGPKMKLHLRNGSNVPVSKGYHDCVMACFPNISPKA